MALIVDIKKKLGAFQMNVSFEAGGGVTALLGASGCGKSMTLKCIAGIEKPDEGFISLDGRVLFDSKKRIDLCPQKRRVGYLFQQYALFPDMTVYQNIAAGVRRERRSEKSAIVAGQIKKMRLEGLEEKRPSQLSGGQQQRVALARILVNQPGLLLLDEPFSALDSYLKWQVELELAETLRDFLGPVLFISHSRDEVFRMCEKVCVLDAGKSEPVTTVTQLFDKPETMSACLLTGCKNFSQIKPAGDRRISALDWGVELDTGENIGGDMLFAGVRAAKIYPATQGATNIIRCRILNVIEDENGCIIILSTPGGRDGRSKLRMELDKSEGKKLRADDEIDVGIAPGDIMLLRK